MHHSARTNPFRPNSLAIALEPRILFDGAAAVAVDHQQDPAGDGKTSDTDHPATSEPAAANRETSASKHLLVLDSRIENRAQLLAGLPSDVTALVVNNNEDGLAAISAALAQMGKVDSVQILSHGSSGQFSLGNQTISASNLDQFSQTLQGWKNNLSAGADIQLYGCDVGAGSAGQTLVNELAQLTGADVGASSNDTGAASKGGDWNLEVRSGDVDQHLALGAVALSSFDGLLANAAPTITVGSPGSDVLLGSQFTFTLNFDNTSSQIGYAPFITLFMPATGKDGNDGTTFVSASYLGNTLASQVVVFDSAGNATNPIAKGSDGQPLVINASTYGMRPGDQMVVIRIPFASVAQAQPELPVVITANLSNLADTTLSNGSPNLTIQAIGGFELGNDSLNNPSTDPSLLQATPATYVVHPTVITFVETLTTPEGETATGPNYSHSYTTTVNAAIGQTLSNVLVTQPLPDHVQVTAITPSAGGTLMSVTLGDGTVLTNAAAISAAIASDTLFISEFTVQYATLTTSANTVVQFYVPQTDSDGDTILDPYNGNAVTITLAPPTASGEWSPLDPRDVVAPATVIDFSGTGTITQFEAKSITLLKDVSTQTDLGTSGLSPGDVLLFKLNVAVSDYFAFGKDYFGDGQFIVVDQLGDGLTLNNTPTLTVTLNGATQTIALVTQQVSNSDGSTTLQFDVATSLQNGFPVRGWFNGDLAFDDTRDGAAVAVISYTALVAQSYTPPSGNPHSEINEGDALGNSAVVTASVLEGRFNITGFDQSDDSSTSTTVPVGQVGISIVSVNGNSANASTAELHPGDEVTFSISYDLTTGDYEQFSLTAYLPQPLFNVSGITWGAGDDPGQWQLGGGNTNAGGVLSVSSGAANSVTFDLGSHVSSATVGSRVEVQFTLRVGNQPFADQRLETVLAQSSQQTTLTDVTLQSSAVVAIISVAEPVLAIAHGVVSASNGTVQGTTGSWKAPGTSGAPFTGSVTSLLAVEGKVTGFDGSDVLRLATAIENTGGGGAFDVSTSIVLPTGLSFVGGDLASANLQIYRGDGTQLVAGVDYSISGNQVTFLDANNQATLLAGRAGTANDTSGANLVVITYDVTTAATIDAGRTLQSAASINHYASSEGGSNFLSSDLSDTADQQVSQPAIRIVYADGSLSENDSSAPHTTGANLVVGESMLYDLVVTLPEGTTQNLRVDDVVPNGLRVDLTFNGGLGYQLITTTAGSGALTSDFAGSLVVSGVSGPGGTVGNDGVDPRYTFSMANASADNVTGNNSFVVRVRLVASNVTGNQAARTLTNSAAVGYNDPDGDTPNGSTVLARRLVLTGSPLNATLREPTLQITQVLTSTSDPGGYDDGDPLAFTLTIRNGSASSDFAAFDISLLNTLPIALDNVVLQGVLYQGAATNNGGTDFEIVGGQLRTTSGANIDIGKGGSIVLTLTGVVNANAAAGGSHFDNVATVQWTSLDGANSGERTGVDGPLQGGSLNDYRRSSTLTVPVPAELILSRVGGLPDTTAPNPTTATTEQVAIGEIIRYRATALMPEGVNADYVLKFTLDNGLDLLSDSIRISFISDGGMTSSFTLTTGGTLNVSGNGTSALLQPITADLSGASPTGVLDPSRVSIATVNGQQVVSLNLGDISNLNDNDVDLEGLSVDFSVRVLNQASNVAGVALGVSAQGSVSGVQRTQSETLFEEVVEPNFSAIDKQVIDFNPNPSGSSGTATVQISTTQDGSLTAYNTHLADGFAGGSNYTLLSLTIDGVSYDSTSLPPGVSLNTTGGISLDFDTLEVGAQVEVVYQVTLPNTAAIASTDATLTWSSLPETFTSWGGSSVGTDGASDGERDGSNVGPNTYIRSEGAGLGVIAGTLWNDSASADTSTTPDGPGLSGLTVTLTWAGVDGDLSTTADNLQFSTTTDSNGQYQFALLPSGLYHIDTPTGTVSYAEPLGPLNVRIDTDAGTLGQIAVTLGEGSTAAADAGYVEQNAAPINTLPGTQTGQEDVQLAIGGISLSDVDADRDPNSASRELSVTLSVLHGTLSLSANPQGAGVTGSGSASLVLTGTQAQLNAALANLRYLGNLNYNGADTLTMVTNDQGNFGDFDGDGIPGEALDDARSDSDSLQINLTAVNDNPVANDDSDTAIEAGGDNNQLPGTNPRGNVLDNDTDVDIATNNDVLRIILAGLDGQAQQNLPSAGTVTIVGLYGSLTLGANGSYEYVVDNSNATVQALRLSGQTLSEAFSYTLSDLLGAQASAVLTITITGANDTPEGVNDSGDATEAGGVLNGTPGSNAGGNVLSNDTDVDSVANGETKHVSQIRTGREVLNGAFTNVPASGTLPVLGSYGTLTIDAAGNYTYVIDNSNTTVQRLGSGDTLSEVFSYRVTDTGNLDDVAELTITIHGAQDNPVASDDAATAQAAATNDSSLESNPSGNVILFPSRAGNTDNGIDTDVDAADRPSSQLQVNGVINKTEASYDPLNDVLTSVTAGGVTLTGQYGALRISADGSYTYDVDSINGAVIALTANQTLSEVFTYRVVDTAGNTDTAQLVITVHGVNDPPVAQPVFSAAIEAGGINNGTAGVNPTGDATRNDTDPDGDPLVISQARPGALSDVGPNTTISTSGTRIAGTYGSLTLRSNGTYTYTLDNANAAVQALRQPGDLLVERFTYTISDGHGGTDQAEIVVVIGGRNDNPLASDDSAIAVEAGGINNGTAGNDPTGNVLSNDTDVDSVANGETKHVGSVRTGAETAAGTAGVIGSQLRGTYGWLTLNSDGSYSYRVDNNLAAVQALRGTTNTLAESFSYTVVDTAGAEDRATLAITLRGANDAPVANNDSATAVEAGGLNNGTPGSNPTGNVLSNDSDVDTGDTLSVIGVGHDAVTGTIGSALAGSYGRLVLNANGSYSYVVDNSNAAVQALRTTLNTLNDTFTYRITDLAGATSTASLTVTIRGSNDNPLAVDDTGTAVEAGGTLNNLPGSNASGNVHSNDVDVDANDSKTVDGIRSGSEAAGGALQTVTGGATVTGLYGQLQINANGTYTYTVNNSLAAVQALKPGQSLVERFTYRSHDLAGASDTAQLTLTIQGAWDAPVAVNDLNYAVADSPLHPGHDADGNVLNNDTDVDGSDSKTVTGIRTGTEAAGGSLDPVVAGSDVTLTGLYGELVISADGHYTYHVDASNPDIIAMSPLDFVREHFTYQVSDGGNLTDLAQLTILVSGGDFPPVAVDDQNVAIDQQPAPHAQGNVLPNDSDVDLNPVINEELQVTGVRTGPELGTGTDGVVGQVLQGRYGTLVLNADGSYSYTIDLNNPEVLAAAGLGQVLKDVFTYTVSDFWGLSDEAQLTIDLDIAAPFVPAPDHGNDPFFPIDDGRDPDNYFPLPKIDPVVFIGPVVERESGISELATWKSDGSNIDLVKQPEIVSDTFNQTLRPIAGQYVKAAVRQSAAASELGLAWILGRHGRIGLSADGLLSDPSVFAPLPVDMLQPKPLPHYLDEHNDSKPAEKAPAVEQQTLQEQLPSSLPLPATGLSARGFTAQLQAAAHRLPPRGAVGARLN